MSIAATRLLVVVADLVVTHQTVVQPLAVSNTVSVSLWSAFVGRTRLLCGSTCLAMVLAVGVLLAAILLAVRTVVGTIAGKLLVTESTTNKRTPKLTVGLQHIHPAVQEHEPSLHAQHPSMPETDSAPRRLLLPASTTTTNVTGFLRLAARLALIIGLHVTNPGLAAPHHVKVLDEVYTQLGRQLHDAWDGPIPFALWIDDVVTTSSRGVCGTGFTFARRAIEDRRIPNSGQGGVDALHFLCETSLFRQCAHALLIGDRLEGDRAQIEIVGSRG
mmetsp:Transcript_18386/g.35985  ORF Transcript_18386/g.35985 Transcript_18386/m.35985 type:complete len:274 (-) Transcript_18386:1177-1998(-)